jgi:asparagine N-glycosylation enzyme membrane subunit Stt3
MPVLLGVLCALPVYFIVQSIIDHARNEPLDYLLIVAAITFLTPAAMALPYSLQDPTLELMYYSLTQPVFLCPGFAGVVVACLASRALKQRKAPAWTFPVSLAGIAVAGLIISYIIMPQLFALAMAGFKVFAPGGGMLTVAEARPSSCSSCGTWSCCGRRAARSASLLLRGERSPADWLLRHRHISGLRLRRSRGRPLHDDCALCY